MLSRNLFKSQALYSKNICCTRSVSFSSENKDITDNEKPNKRPFYNTYRFFNFMNPSNQNCFKPILMI